eukprot:748898-Prorocentrum_lima.AAC.1
MMRAFRAKAAEQHEEELHKQGDRLRKTRLDAGKAAAGGREPADGGGERGSDSSSTSSDSSSPTA